MSVQRDQRAINEHNIEDSFFETLQVIQELPKKSIFAPSLVPRVDRMPIPVVRGQITPRNARS